MKVIPCGFLTQHGNKEFQIVVDGVPLAIMAHREIELPEEDRHVHEFGVKGWNMLVQEFNLDAGTRIIFTNLLNNTLSLMPFDESGFEMRSEIVPRMPLNWKKPFMRSPIDEGMLMNLQA